MRRMLFALAAGLTVGCSGGGGSGGTTGTGGYPPCSSGCATPMNECDPASGRCVPTGCSQTGCAVAGFYCDDFYDYCTTAPHCLADGNCPAGWACFESDNTCRPLASNGCRAHADCPVGQLCDLTAHVCRAAVGCQGAGTGCPSGYACDPDYVCRPVPPGGCYYHYQCSMTYTVLCVHDDADPYTPGWCAGCATNDAVCGGTLHACDATRDQCKTCNGDADCPAPLVCGWGGCVECYDAADCKDPAKPVCFYDTCTECAVTADCAAKPGTICNTYGACVPSTGSECPVNACPANRPYCDSGTHLCNECLTDANCGNPDLRCTIGWCQPWPPGDRCSDAAPLALAPDHTILIANVKQFVYRCESFCSSPNGDAFWTFTLDAPASLEILNADPNYPPAKVEVFTAGCAQLVASKAGPVAWSPLATPALAAGTPYVLRVEADGSLREYTLLIQRTAVP